MHDDRELMKLMREVERDLYAELVGGPL